jgi:hypothetical protein
MKTIKVDYALSNPPLFSLYLFICSLFNDEEFRDTWNVRSLCRSVSLTGATRELASYKLGVQEILFHMQK